MRRLLLFLTVFCLAAIEAMAQAGSGVYVGGHIRRERPATVQKLKNSGFTYVILFNINVETDGTLTTDGETVCRDGEYVFGTTQPHYVDDVRELKTWPTGISRVEICIGGWENESYYRIKDLIDQQGTGEESILYRNFQALRNAIPEIDAVNNDDEHCYDVASAVAFHSMMWTLGYHTTLAPYTRKSFWNSLASLLNASCPGACDRVLVQCYDGGAGNNPSDWQIEGLPVHAGRTNYQTDMDTSIQQMQSWHDNNGVVGGFVWVYNDETWNLNAWASAMNRVFPSREVITPAVTLYSNNNFGGYEVSLPVGEFCTGELSVYGMADNDIASYMLEEGYTMEAFDSSDLSGQGKVLSDTEMSRMGAWANRISSLRVIPTGDNAVTEMPDDADAATCFYDLQGRRIPAPPSHGLYMVRKNHLITKRIAQ